MEKKNLFQKAIAEIKLRSNYFHGEKGNMENSYQVVKNASPKTNGRKIGRVVMLGGIDLAWFLWCLGKYTVKDLNTILLDNKIIDSFKEKNKNTKIKDTDKNFQKFFKNFDKSYPMVSARLKLWMLYSLLITMGVGGIKLSGKDSKDNSEKAKQEILSKTNDFNSKDVVEFGAEDLMTIYNVNDNDFSKTFVEENWNGIVISLCEFETWLPEPKKLSGETRYTYGPGLTWVYTKDSKGNITQNPCSGKWKNMAEKFTRAEIWEQVKLHILYTGECMAQIKKQLQQYGFEEVSAQQVLALVVAGYQLPGRLSDNYSKTGKFISDGIIHKLKDAGSNKQKQIDAFICGNEVNKKWREGTNKRRWWCAMMYLGKVSVADLLEMDRDAFSLMDINTILRNGHFVKDDATIIYCLSKTNTKGSVRQFVETCDLIQFGDKIIKQQKHEIHTTENLSGSMDYAYNGLKAYQNKDYNNAAKYYEKAIEKDSDNMEAYSSLVLTYKKIADETHSVSDYEKSLDIVRKCNIQMNKNKKLLYDENVKAALYYNAGLAHKEIAKIYKADKNNDMALEHYEKAIKNFVTAYKNAESIDSHERMKTYQTAKEDIEKDIKILKNTTKKTKFKSGANKTNKKMKRANKAVGNCDKVR